MKASIALKIGLAAIIALAPVTTLSETDCPRCNCSHFPISDPSCAKCCFSQKGIIASVSSTAVTVLPAGEEPAKTYEVKKSTKINGRLKEGGGATIYYHIVGGKNVATRIDGPGFFRGSLIPADLPSPPDTCEEIARERFRRTGHRSPPIPPDAMRIFFGTSEAYSTDERFIVWKIGDDDTLVLQKTEMGMSVSAKLRGPDGRLMAQIVDNEFFINTHGSFRIRRADNSSLAVYNEKDERLLSIEFVNPRVIKILGSFFGSNGDEIIITEDEAVFMSKAGSKFVSSRSCFGGSEHGTIEISSSGTISVR